MTMKWIDRVRAILFAIGVAVLAVIAAKLRVGSISARELAEAVLKTAAALIAMELISDWLGRRDR